MQIYSKGNIFSAQEVAEGAIWAQCEEAEFEEKAPQLFKILEEYFQSSAKVREMK